MTTTATAQRHVTHELAQWAYSLTYESLNDEAIAAAKRFIYDSVGCALGGSRQEDVHLAMDLARELGAAGPCRIIGSDQTAHLIDSTFLNSLCIRAMDFNDIYWRQDPVHPSDLIAAAFAVCEANGLGGKDLILGVVIGHELEMRLAEIASPGVREYGWHHATLTAFASPVVAGRLLDLDAKQMQHAIGISASHCCTLGAVAAGELTMMKNTVDPMAVRAGVEAALLAKRGFTGPAHVLDGKEGIADVFGHAWDMAALTADLPHCPKCRYRITECGMKSFPIEALSHAPLTAMLKCVKENNIEPGDVQEIRVEVIARAADILGDPAKYRPTGKETADHSLPYSLAVGLVDGVVTPAQFTQRRIDDPALAAVMDKVKVVANEEFEALFPQKQPSRVTITLHDGRTFSKRVDVPKGDARDPMTPDEIKVKFDALGRDVIGQAGCDLAGEIIMSLESEPSLERLFDVLMTK